MVSFDQTFLVALSTLTFQQINSFSFRSNDFLMNNIHRQHITTNIQIQPEYRRSTSYLMAMADDDDDDDDDEYDDIQLGDWRQFRMNLAETGIKTPQDVRKPAEDKDESANSAISEEPKRPRSVSKKNEELLKSQNQQLADEYLSGVWAHEISEPELGSLVCRLPVEAEIWRSKGKSSIGRKLQNHLKLDEDESDDVPSNKPARETAYYSADDEEDEEVDGSSSSNSFSPLAAKTMFWYRGAQSLIKKEMQKLADKAEDGAIDASQLTPELMELLNIYMDNQVSSLD